MDVFRTDRIRNVVLLGHGGAGKTTLAEATIWLYITKFFYIFQVFYEILTSFFVNFL